jgi:hypothetical protein
MGGPDRSGLAWRRSSRSTGADYCTEVARIADGVAVRDSKDPFGPVLAFTLEAWRRFVADVRRGAFDASP